MAPAYSLQATAARALTAATRVSASLSSGSASTWAWTAELRARCSKPAAQRPLCFPAVRPSTSPSLSLSICPSPSPSLSLSICPSPSTSPSPSPSLSICPSPSTSPNLSVRPSTSPSLSLSICPSPSISPISKATELLQQPARTIKNASTSAISRDALLALWHQQA